MAWNKNKRLEEIALEDFHGSPRINSWIPKHSDIAKIAGYTRLIKNPKILDAGCGKGFVSALFALEGLNVLGVDIDLSIEDLRRYSDVFNLGLKRGDIVDGKWYGNINAVFNSWMPQGIDWGSYFVYAKPTPNMIIYVKSRSTGMQPEMPGNYNHIDSYNIPLKFIEIDRWKCFGNDDFKDDETPVIVSKTGEVIVQLRTDIYLKNPEKFKEAREIFLKVPPYNWEKELPN